MGGGGPGIDVTLRDVFLQKTVSTSHLGVFEVTNLILSVFSRTSQQEFHFCVSQNLFGRARTHHVNTKIEKPCDIPKLAVIL